jgi:hypothetical protein
MRALRKFETTTKELPWIASEVIGRWLDPRAVDFYARLRAGGYSPDLLVNVVPSHKLIYVSIPKAPRPASEQRWPR